MSTAVTIIMPPTDQPVNVAELKDHLRMMGDDGSHDVLLGNLIAAATAVFENATGRALITRTLRYHLDNFPTCGVIFLPKPPAIEVLTIKYLDATGQQQTLSADMYHADTAHVPGRIATAPDKAWPSTCNLLGAVTVDYTAGYGASAAVPTDIKAAIKMLGWHMYDNPSATTSMSLNETPLAVRTIIDAYRMPVL